MAISLFVWYHLRPAIRHFLRGVTTALVLSSLVLGPVLAYGYGSFFAAVQRGMVPLAVSASMLRGFTSLFAIGFLVAGLHKRPAFVTLCSLTAVAPENVLQVFILTSSSQAIAMGGLYLATALPFVVRLSASLERGVMHAASDAVTVLPGSG